MKKDKFKVREGFIMEVDMRTGQESRLFPLLENTKNKDLVLFLNQAYEKGLNESDHPWNIVKLEDGEINDTVPKEAKHILLFHSVAGHYEVKSTKGRYVGNELFYMNIHDRMATHWKVFDPKPPSDKEYHIGRTIDAIFKLNISILGALRTVQQLGLGGNRVVSDLEKTMEQAEKLKELITKESWTSSK